MSLSTRGGKAFDVGQVGFTQQQLPPFEQGPINLGAWFGFAAPALPLELEIGSGKGTFLVQHAAGSPQVNYLGIEYAKAYWRYAADRCRRHGLDNVRLLHAEAAMFLRHYVGDESLRQVHIYFPDPWPKKRHHKRRLIQVDLLERLHRVLTSPQADDPQVGQVHIATDHEDYYQWMLEKVEQVSHLFERQAFGNCDSAEPGELVGTNFERKYRQEGRSFYGMILRKSQD